MLNQFILKLLQLYRFLTQAQPKRCRFYPSCSHYAHDAYTHFGFWKATQLTIKRLLKCHPFHPGGVDILEGGTHATH